jgi:hypothetical protein
MTIRRIPGTPARDASTTSLAETQCNAPLRRRRAAAIEARLLACGCSDPWTCKHYQSVSEVSDVQVDAYRDTALTLLALGYTPAPNIPAMRVLWRRGGDDQRLVRKISQTWVVAA